MDLPFLLDIATSIVILTTLDRVNTSWSLAKRMLLGMVLGTLFGLALYLVYGNDSAMFKQSTLWFSIVGGGYIQLLQMIVVPFVLVLALNSVAKLNGTASLGRISVLTIGTLLLITLISALANMFVTHLFGLAAQGLVRGAQETARLTAVWDNYVGKVADSSALQLVQSFVPRDPFTELIGVKSVSIIGVVAFAAFLDAAALSLLKDDAVRSERVLTAINTAQAWAVRLVRFVTRLTPYDVLALMTNVVAVFNVQDIIKLGGFMVAPYLSLAIILGMHAVLFTFSDINPFRFFRKVWPAPSFTLTSQFSAATIPLSIEAQTRYIGMPESITSFTASFGTTIGQNGRAGLHPAMLAVTVAPTVGISLFDPVWIATFVAVVTLSSVGVVGVGGGATFAILIILPAMGLSAALVALLISIGPLIDMGRTALNASGSVTAGAITSQLLGQADRGVSDIADDMEMVCR